LGKPKIIIICTRDRKDFSFAFASQLKATALQAISVVDVDKRNKMAALVSGAAHSAERLAHLKKVWFDAVQIMNFNNVIWQSPKLAKPLTNNKLYLMPPNFAFAKEAKSNYQLVSDEIKRSVFANGHSNLWAITGFNPMGEERDLAANLLANSKLRDDLLLLTKDNGIAMIAEFAGTNIDESWSEAGFGVFFDITAQSGGQLSMLQLCKKYNQMALYNWSFDASTGRITQKVVVCDRSNAAVESTRDDIVLVQAAKTSKL
jgi:hypothetical protein